MAQYKNFATYNSTKKSQEVKETFKELNQLIPEYSKKDLRMLDVGCASGALIRYLNGLYPDWAYTGLDISKDLLAIAKDNLPKVNWVEGSVIKMPSEFEGKFDLTTCLGVLGIFDEEEAIRLFDELIRCTKPGGTIIILSQFNEFDVDTQISHRKYNKSGVSNGWEKGFNNYSEHTINEWLKNKVKKINFNNFAIPFELRQQDDKVRTWTVDINQKRKLTNGLKLIVDLKFLKITL